MASKTVDIHDDNPEWQDEDFAKAKRGADVLPAMLVDALKRPTRPGQIRVDDPRRRDLPKAG